MELKMLENKIWSMRYKMVDEYKIPPVIHGYKFVKGREERELMDKIWRDAQEMHDIAKVSEELRIRDIEKDEIGRLKST